MAQAQTNSRAAPAERQIKQLLVDTESFDELRERSEESRLPTSLSKDDIFDVLSNRRRRDILQYLKSHDGHATTSELAEFIAAKENETSVRGITSRQRKRVYVGVYQNHLPRMAKLGVIDYEKNRGNVRLGEAFEQVEPYLTDDADPRIRMIGGGVGLFGAAAVLFGFLGLLPVSGSHVLAMGLLCLIVVLVGDSVPLFTRRHGSIT